MDAFGVSTFMGKISWRAKRLLVKCAKTKKMCSHCNVSICSEEHMCEYDYNSILPMDSIVVRGRYMETPPRHTTETVKNY